MIYFDTSFLTPLFREEETTTAVERFMERAPASELAVSRWTMVEFASVLARDVRMGLVNAEQASRQWAAFDSVVSDSFVVLLPTGSDYEQACRFLQRHETGLRAGDALHLAIAANHGAQAIYSLDRVMARAGAALGLPVSRGIGEG